MDPRIQKIMASAIALVFLAGCSTTNPFTGEGEWSNASKGAAMGALAGAAVGALSGSEDRGKRALIGAGVGALAGGAVGTYMDRQEAKLREQLAGTGVSVTRQGDNLILNMPGNITFASSSSDIRSDFYDVLNSVVLVLNEFDKTLIQVIGHTDSTGSLAFNKGLSERRGSSVGQYLISQGVNRMRVDPMGFGPDHPVASNSTPEGRSLNRRVELRLVPITE